MKLKQVFKLSFAVFLVFVLSSCNDDSDYVQEGYSKDTQIYGFKLTAKPVTSADTVNYPILAKTKFAIDQFRNLIYNPDSLPYQTSLRKCLATINFGTSGVSKVELLYANDSVASWESTTDSIDFSPKLLPQFKITAADGVSSRIYTVDIRIHQVNPDLLVWEEMTYKIMQPSSIKDQKTLLIEHATIAEKDTFYTFSRDNDNQLYLHKAARGKAYSEKNIITGFSSPSNVNLDNITMFNGKFYVVDVNKKGYSSEDGIVWTAKASGIHSIVGVLPGAKAENDSLLVITDGYSFAKTADLSELKTVRAFNSLELDKFPISGFSSITNFDRSNLNKNLLVLTGGENVSGKSGRLTWLIQVSSDNVLRLTSNEEHTVFSNLPGIVNFMYDDYLYALIANKLYKSASFGYKWIVAPDTEVLDPSIPKASAQSVVVDRDNYIWIFGGISTISNDPIHAVWKGRLNKLNPKL